MRLPIKVSQLLQPLTAGVSQIESAIERPIAQMGLPTPPRIASTATSMIIEGIRTVESAIESLPAPQLPAGLPQLPTPTAPTPPAAPAQVPAGTFAVRKQRIL